ncbi:MAG: hypothetical protein AAGC60_20065 [Acidobacteriota bacterium]
MRPTCTRWLVALAFLGVLLASSSVAHATESPRAQVAAQHEAMQKVAWLVGSWHGEGWIEYQPGERMSFRSTETVGSYLDGLVLVIEGLHHDAASGDVIHHAIGMLSSDPQADLLRFRTHLSNGRAADSTGHLEGDAFVWSPPTPPGVAIRYTIRRDAGDWFEIGEMSRDGGSTWRQTFEMRLQRTTEAPSTD